jgi:hypothetical protein
LLLNPLCGESKLKVLSEESDDNEFVNYIIAGGLKTFSLLFFDYYFHIPFCYGIFSSKFAWILALKTTVVF